jgi:hypothetical protein
MNRWTRLALLLSLPTLLSLGCGDKDDDDEDDEDTADGDGGGGGDGGDDSLMDSMLVSTGASSNCEEVEGQTIPGATGFFVGLYTDEGGGEWSGDERWVLYANEAWRDAGEGDCEIRWTTVASETDCGGCDVGLVVNATIDLSSTSCPEDLWSYESNWTSTYNVSSGGEATFSYAGSGTLVGTGPATDTQLGFISEASCHWF